MKVRFSRLIITMILAFASYSCNLFEDWFKFEDYFREVKTVDVGPEGATISSDEVELIIPAGVFTENAEIVLSVNKLFKPFDSETYTPVYEFTGIPNNSEGKIEIRLKVDGYTAEEVEIAVGDYFQPKGADSVSLHFITIDTKDSAGFLCGEIAFKSDQEYAAAGLKSETAKTHSRRLYVTVTKKMKQMVAGKFYLIYHDKFADWIEKKQNSDLMKKICIDTYLRFENEEGYRFDMSRFDAWPLRVYIQEEGNDGVFCGHWFSTYIIINLDIVRYEFEKFEPVFAHEFFHLMEYIYYGFRNNGSEDEWFDEAAAVFVEKLHQYEEDPEYFPSVAMDNFGLLYLGLVNGWQYMPEDGSKKERSKQGYANAVLLEYLIESKHGNDMRASEKAIAAMVKGIAGQNDVFDLIKQDYGPVDQWLSDFYASIYQLKLYGGNNMVFGAIPKYPQYNVNIDGSKDSLYSIPYDVIELSATALTLKFSNFSSDCNVSIKASDHKIPKSQIEYLVFHPQSKELIGKGFSEYDSVYIQDFVNALKIRDNVQTFNLPLFIVNKTEQAGKTKLDVQIRVTNNALPEITGVTPSKAKPGQVITINGKNFKTNQGNSEVRFNGQVLVVNSWKDQEITTVLPSDAKSGNVFVKVKGMKSNEIFIEIEDEENNNISWPKKYLCKEITFYAKIRCGTSSEDDITISGSIVNDTITGENGVYTFNKTFVFEDAVGYYNADCDGICTSNTTTTVRQAKLVFKPDADSPDGSKGKFSLQLSVDMQSRAVFDNGKSNESTSSSLLSIEDLSYNWGSTTDHPYQRKELMNNAAASGIVTYLKALSKSSKSTDCAGNVTEVESCQATSANIQVFIHTINLSKLE
jgi:hypothetical protein